MSRLKKLLIFSLIINLILVAAIGALVYRLGGPRYFLYRLKSKGLTALYEHRKDLYNQLPERMGEIIFLGDSITEAGAWSELFNKPLIINRGIAGDTSSGLLRRLEEVLRSNPAKIFLMIGVNDLLFVGSGDILKNYEAIIKQIKEKSPDTKLYLQSVLPVNREVSLIPIKNETINDLNTGIQELAEKYDLPYLDIHQLLKDDKGQLNEKYTSDGIHLNGAAYLTWTKAIAQHLNDDI